MKQTLALIVILSSLLVGVLPAHAATVAESVSGKILLDVESHGEAWYVYPVTLQRHYLEDGDAAYAALQDFGLGITDEDLAKIPVGLESRFVLPDADGDDVPDAVEVSIGTDANEPDSDADGYGDAFEIAGGYDPLGTGRVATDAAMVERLEGRILLQVETHGEAWYVNPGSGKRYYLGNGEAAYEVMRYLSLGITRANLALVPISAGSSIPASEGTSFYHSYALVTDEGTFDARVAMLRRDAFRMVTDTGDVTDCVAGCTAHALAEYVAEHGAFAGIHGTYFCPPDYADCATKTYSFLPPVLNAAADAMINDDTLVHHDRPIVAETTDGELSLYHRASDFGDTWEDYRSSGGETLSALIGNWPSLLEDGESVVAGESIESAFLNVGTRGGIGWNDTFYFLVVASSATVPNLAAIFESLGATNAMNLDGGGSAALYYDGAYKAGPGRLLPNAILFVER